MPIGSAEVRDEVRILLVDDDAGLRALLKTTFEVVDVEVDEAESAAAAAAAIEAKRPDVVVLDIRMPPTFTDDGLRAAKEIRRRHPDVAVLVLSQYAEPTYARELLAHGSRKVGYFLKDRISDVDGFSAALERLVAGEVVLDPTLT